MTDTATPPPPIPNALLCQIGEVLYGSQWVAALARDLGVQHRTVERWKVGDSRVSPRIAPDLLELLLGRREANQRLTEALAAFIDPDA